MATAALGFEHMADVEGRAIAPAEAKPAVVTLVLPKDQADFLIRFSFQYVTGRKALCWVARAVVAVGAVAGAIWTIVELGQHVAGWLR